MFKSQNQCLNWFMKNKNGMKVDMKENSFCLQVKNLQAELEGEETLRNVLHYALNGPMLSNPCLSSYLPPQVCVCVVYIYIYICFSIRELMIQWKLS